uniref:60S ribosomal protein L13a n=1 Tax=Meloidogyne floridensis TaxID=298350 RepID=A0A915PC86_9BILA
IRIETIACLSKLLNNLEPWMVADQLLPSLPKVNSKDPGLYKLIFENDRFGISKEQCAKSVIPFLVSTSIEASLNLSNFNQFIDFIHCLLDKMTTEHKHYLGKLSASQEEQREVNNFIDYLNNGKVLEEIVSNEGSPIKQQQTAAGVSMDLGDLDFLVGGGTTKKNEKENTINFSQEPSFLTNNLTSHSLNQQQKSLSSSFISPPSSLVSSQNFNNKKEGEEPSINFDVFSSTKINLNEEQKQQPSLDFLAEFLPPPTSSLTTTSTFSQQQQQQKQSFNNSSSFPSLPIPPPNNNNFIPIQRKNPTTNHNNDPFNFLINQQLKEENVKKEENGEIDIMTKPILIDGKNHLLGRLAAIVAKQLLLGQKIVIVRGMLPHKTARGMEALKKLKCFDGCPHPYDKRKKFVLPNSLRHIALKPRRKYCTVGRLAHEVGWQYQGIVEKLEEKRKVKGTAYYTKKKAEMKLKRQAIEKAKSKTAVYDKVLEQYGYA